MNHPRGQVPPSQRFRHVSRPLREGEKVPGFPTLLQQVQACHTEMARAAREEPGPRPEDSKPDAVAAEWEADIEDAA